MSSFTDVVGQGPVGPQGPQGIQGPQGPAGTSAIGAITLLKRSITEQIIVNSAVENEIGRISFADFPTLKNGDRIRIRYFAHMLQNSGGGASYTFRLQHSGPFTPLVVTLSPSNNANRAAVQVEYELIYMNIGTVVHGRGHIMLNSVGSTQMTNNAALTSITASNNLLGSCLFAGNWTAGSFIYWAVQMSVANANMDLRVPGWTAELLAA